MAKQLRRSFCFAPGISRKHIPTYAWVASAFHHGINLINRNLFGLFLLNEIVLLEDFTRSFRDIKLRGFLAGGEVIALPIISMVQTMVHFTVKGHTPSCPNPYCHPQIQQPQQASDIRSWGPQYAPSSSYSSLLHKMEHQPSKFHSRIRACRRSVSYLKPLLIRKYLVGGQLLISAYRRALQPQLV